jgi:hypothetical protein
MVGIGASRMLDAGPHRDVAVERGVTGSPAVTPLASLA